MSTQFFLDELDIEKLAKIMLRSQQVRTREALCIRIGIDPRRLWFIRDSSDSDFVIQLINYLNEISNQESLCKLCCEELLPIFRNSETNASILEDIAVKLNCNQKLSHNHPNSSQNQNLTSTNGLIFNRGISTIIVVTGLVVALGGGLIYYFTQQRQQVPLVKPQTSGRLIRNSLYGKCIDVAGTPGKVNGAQLQLWDCEESGYNAVNDSPTDQRWVVTPEGLIKNTLSEKCIDVAGSPGKGNGAQLQLWDCEESGYNADNDLPTDQRWMLTPNGLIKNKLSGKCIDVADAPVQVNGAQLQLRDCEVSGRNADNGSPTDQRWSLL